MACTTPAKPIIQAWVSLEPAMQRGARGELGRDTLSISQLKLTRAHYPCLSFLACLLANSDSLRTKAIEIKQNVVLTGRYAATPAR